MMNFQCTWDTAVISTTTIDIVVILGVIIMLALYAIRYQREEEKLRSWGYWVGVAVAVFILFFPALFCPLSVSVGNESVSIHRIKGDIIVPIETIEEIRKCNDSDTKGGRREFGSGGAFGYLGKFSSSKLGNYQMYATDASKRILIKNKKGEYLIFSCDKPEEVIERVNRLKNTELH